MLWNLIWPVRCSSKVIQLKTEHMADADAQLKFLQKVQQATPETEAGKKIALVKRMTRADAAAILMEELKIKELYKKPELKVDTPLKTAEKVSPEVKEQSFNRCVFYSGSTCSC